MCIEKVKQEELVQTTLRILFFLCTATGSNDDHSPVFPPKTSRN